MVSHYSDHNISSLHLDQSNLFIIYYIWSSNNFTVAAYIDLISPNSTYFLSAIRTITSINSYLTIEFSGLFLDLISLEVEFDAINFLSISDSTIFLPSTIPQAFIKSVNVFKAIDQTSSKTPKDE